MDTDTKSNSEERDHKEASEIKIDSGKEIDGDGDDKTDIEEETEKQKKEEMEDMDVSDKADDKTIDTTDKKEEVSRTSGIGDLRLERTKLVASIT